MKRYLVQIEFRYTRPRDRFGNTHACKTVCLGIADTLDGAIFCGNTGLVVLEGRFRLNPAYNTRQRFSKNELLITNLGYIKTPFEFYAQIVPLDFVDLGGTIADIVKEVKAGREEVSKEVSE
jgi:hypothetical protein